MDLDAKLFLAPGKRKVKSVAVDPTGALTVTPAPPARSGQLQYVVKGVKWGRARLTLTYDDGQVQTIHYDVTKPAAEAVADMGRFLTTKAWYTDESDPFGRAPSVMNYDRANNRIVLQDTRAWVAGLGDEGGAGGWLLGGDEGVRPAEQRGGRQARRSSSTRSSGDGCSTRTARACGASRRACSSTSPAAMPDYKYQDGNWTSWTSWNKQAAEAVDRAYDYPHVVAAYWSMYRLARNNPGLIAPMEAGSSDPAAPSGPAVGSP